MLKIYRQKQFIQVLKTNIDKNVVIHYVCPFCSDEQVTYEEEAQDILDTFQEYEYLITGYECTSCGMMMKVINIKNIFGLEIMEE